MPLLKAFNNFAPLNDPVNSTIPNAFDWESIAVRARKILASRTEQQVRDALVPLNKMLEEGLTLEEITAVMTLAIASDQNIYPMSDTNALRLYMSNSDPEEQPEFPKATWGEYFALLALAKIGLAINSANSNQDVLKEMTLSIGADPESVTAQQEVLQNEYVLEATEAISAAETFVKSLIEAQLEVKKINSRGGKTRGAYYSPLKDFVRAAWEDRYTDISNRKAAKKIWAEVPQALKLYLATDDPEHTLEIWIGQYKGKKI